MFGRFCGGAEGLKKVEVLIPAKIMLAGEYAVLRGGHALAATLENNMRVLAALDPKSPVWEIASNIWTEPRIVNIDDRLPHADPLCRAVQFAGKHYALAG